MSIPQAPCNGPARADQAEALTGLRAIRDRISLLADEREKILVATVDEITRRSQSEDVIRTLLPEAGISRNTYYPRRNSRPAARSVHPSQTSLSELKHRRRRLETQIESATADRNRALRCAEGIETAALAAAAGVTETWVRLLRRSG
ncbi:hypothetical protein SPF06_18935 [Sinomonas sp. JGH33]|uniref:Transposase n=1 Tax=Sinomonas terricola TaxID=3110330 RepID=A0ABU5TB41_9MICC|nr:hypothetical protein [Sinomonas sp. JGH33]MEA5456803.1 hypothetical protein [Sinomonas sp. JGH33]